MSTTPAADLRQAVHRVSRSGSAVERAARRLCRGQPQASAGLWRGDRSHGAAVERKRRMGECAARRRAVATVHAAGPDRVIWSACTNWSGEGPTAVMFHRGHWCGYCRLNLHAVGEKRARRLRPPAAASSSSRRSGRSSRRSFRTEANAPISSADRSRQRLRHVAQPCDLARPRFHPADQQLRARRLRNFRVTMPGWCRSRQPSLSVATATSWRASSIRISASAWSSMICSTPSRARADAQHVDHRCLLLPPIQTSTCC